MFNLTKLPSERTENISFYCSNTIKVSTHLLRAGFHYCVSIRSYTYAVRCCQVSVIPCVRNFDIIGILLHLGLLYVHDYAIAYLK